MAHFLANAGVAESLQEDVANQLQCRECGAGEFGLWDDIGVEDADARAYRLRWQEWQKKHSELLLDFGRHLERYPYLGLSHPMGKRIHRAISHFPLTTLRSRQWWRARKPDGARIFTAVDMQPPPPERATSEGRFNHFGQVTFYLASTPQAALAETLRQVDGEGVGWVQAFRLPVGTKVLDLVTRGFGEDYDVPVLAMGLINHLPRLRPNSASPWKPEYFIPRFIADCARERNIHGVVFSSDKHFDQNLALFQWDQSRVKPLGVPKLRLLSTPSALDEMLGGPALLPDDF